MTDRPDRVREADLPEPGEAAVRDDPMSAPAPAEPAPAEDPDEQKRKPTKAERLEAKAARLRAAEQRRVDEPASPRPRRWVIATAALGALSALLVAALVVGFLYWHTRRANDDAAQSALTTAQKYATQFGSYDYQHVDTEFAKMATHLTPDFKQNYLQTTNLLLPTLKRYKGTVVATVRCSGVRSANTQQAVVVICLDQKVTNTALKKPEINRNRLVMTLVRSDGHWLIDKLSQV